MSLSSKLVLLLLLSSNLFAVQSGLYIELGSGLKSSDKLKTIDGKYTLNSNHTDFAALGYQIEKFRIEYEYRYTKNELESYSDVKISGDVFNTSNMLNIYYSGYNKTKLVSSIGIGVGVSDISIEKIRYFTAPKEDTKEDSIPTAQAMFSVGYMINEDLTLSTKYTYVYIDDSDSFDSNQNNIFTIALRYLF